MKKDAELDEVIRIARLASDVVSAVYATPFTVELKGPNDPVTRADRDANTLICDALAKAFPGDAILAEESVPEDAAELRRIFAGERVWFVDPLDGTKEFADKNGEFAVMIGLAERGRARLGVVARPTTGDVFAGRAEGSAFVEAKSGTRTTLAVSEVNDPTRATLLVSRSHRPSIVAPVSERLGLTRLLPCGSVGVKVSRIMTGEADLYVHGGRGAKRWDTCAPEAILRGAGGRFTDLFGKEIDYSIAETAQKAGILASNAALFEAIVAITREAFPACSD